MSCNINAKKTKKFTSEDKEKLKDKIDRLKPIYQLKILEIIGSELTEYTINSKGVLLFFHNFSDDVYNQISNYLNKLEKNRHKKLIESLASDLSDTIIKSDNIINENKATSDIINTIEIDNEKNLNNKEKAIMRRKKYDEYLQKNQS